MAKWRYHTPRRDGDAPPDWVDGWERHLSVGVCEWQALSQKEVGWSARGLYRYRPAETYEHARNSVRVAFDGEICRQPHIIQKDDCETWHVFDDDHTWGDIARWVMGARSDGEELHRILGEMLGECEHPTADDWRNRAKRAEQECEELRKCLKIEQTAADDHKRESEILWRMLERSRRPKTPMQAP